MYIKLSVSANFTQSARYIEGGLSPSEKQQKAGKVKLLYVHNILSTDAEGIASEMKSVASCSRSKKPVWHLLFSPGKGQEIEVSQWPSIFEMYAKIAGIVTDNHQYALWLYEVNGRRVMHSLLNAVPITGRPALKSFLKGVIAKNAAFQIDEQIGHPQLAESSVQKELAQKLEAVLSKKPASLDGFERELVEQGIKLKLFSNDTGIYGATFQLVERNHKPIRGSQLKINDKPCSWRFIAERLSLPVGETATR